jgi:hypothetical protein
MSGRHLLVVLVMVSGFKISRSFRQFGPLVMNTRPLFPVVGNYLTFVKNGRLEVRHRLMADNSFDGQQSTQSHSRNPSVLISLTDEETSLFSLLNSGAFSLVMPHCTDTA